MGKSTATEKLSPAQVLFSRLQEASPDATAPFSGYVHTQHDMNTLDHQREIRIKSGDVIFKESNGELTLIEEFEFENQYEYLKWNGGVPDTLYVIRMPKSDNKTKIIIMSEPWLLRCIENPETSQRSASVKAVKSVIQKPATKPAAKLSSAPKTKAGFAKPAIIETEASLDD
jgi:hypothetical protein